MTYTLYNMSAGGAGRCQGSLKDGTQCKRFIGWKPSGQNWYCHHHGKTHTDDGRKIPSDFRSEPKGA